MCWYQSLGVELVARLPALEAGHLREFESRTPNQSGSSSMVEHATDNRKTLVQLKGPRPEEY